MSNLFGEKVMQSIVGARVLSGTVVELAKFAQDNGYKLQSNQRGYITFVPLVSSNHLKIQYTENVVQLHQN
ncbi:MAG: hypothetical protein V3U88_03200 [Methylococcales bacterium]